MLFVERMIEKLRRKGYDDFYLADLANKWDWFTFFMLFILQAGVVMGIFALPFALVGLNWMKYPIWGAFGMGWVGAMLFVCLFTAVPDATVREGKDQGETDQRMTSLFASLLSEFSLKILRRGPAISVVVLIIVYIVSLFLGGFTWLSLVSLVASFVLLLALSPLYYKCLGSVMANGVYYVNWKTDQNVEHYEELVSRHERWWRPSAELDFEKYNIDRYRVIRVSSSRGNFHVHYSRTCLCIVIVTPHRSG